MDCGDGSCLSGSFYSGCDIKYGRNGSGNGGSGCGINEGDRRGGSMCDSFGFCLCLRTIITLIAPVMTLPQVELVLCARE